nr:putative rna-binding protein [Quercus suber]
MNINALLSPSDDAEPLASPSASSRDGSQPAPLPPRKQQHQQRPVRAKRTHSNLSQEITFSPNLSASQVNSPTRSVSARDTQFSPLPFVQETVSSVRPSQPPTSHPHAAQDYQRPHSQSQRQRPTVAHRPSSMPHMGSPVIDARSANGGFVANYITPGLPDVSIGSYSERSPRLDSPSKFRTHDMMESRRSPSVMQQAAAAPPPMLRNGSGQSLADLTMAEAPAQTPPPRDITSSALSQTESKSVTELLNHLRGNSYAYGSHIQLINLLHKGFVAHSYGSEDAGGAILRDPSSYGLMHELRQAREAMDSRFAVGEDVWLDWLADEALLARTSDERLVVTELFQKAVHEEPASTKLWTAYADWVQACFSACNDLAGSDQTRWAADDKEVCKELFTREMLGSVLEQAVSATQWRIDESHLLWNRFAKFVYEEMPAAPSQSHVDQIRGLYVQRLQVPHATWAETYQMFWPIVNTHESERWEAIMDQINEMAEPANHLVRARGDHEFQLQKAISSGVSDSIFAEFDSYLAWEAKMASKTKRKNNAQQNDQVLNHVRCTLFERALLRFPTYTEWWLDYINFVVISNVSSSVLPLIERATRHCPWSGDLWGKRLLRADVEQKSLADIEQTKHRATNSGLLDVGGMEEMLKVLQQWCSYLRRHAFRRGSSEDDLDTAEVGITMAIEDIDQAGKTIYGPDFQGDPLYRLETIQIKFLSEARRFKDARDIYKKLAGLQGSKYDFWQTYYQWELWLWGYERISEQHRVETSENGPHLATAVVQQALKQRTLDEPEKVLALYLNHFQQHESGEKLQTALIDAREFSWRLAIKKATEVAESANIAPQQQSQPADSTSSQQYSSIARGEKRKADDNAITLEDSKKSRIDDAHASALPTEQHSSAPIIPQATRDREHNTVTVRNLAKDTTEIDIKKFFRDVGDPKSINITHSISSGATATVEFESAEDVLTAKSRDGKQLGGSEVRITSGNQTTLYVTNYPATYDEATIRSLFDSYGEITGVRFPSLRFNSKRRFCYVSFLEEGMARTAETAMDGKMLDGLHKLVAKISNPDAKKSRDSSAQEEGREIVVKNMAFKIAEADIRQLFQEYGTIERVHLVKKINGQFTGTVFLVFSTAEEALAACAAQDKKPFHDRILQVVISTPKGGATPMDKARKTDIVVKGVGASMSPEPGALDARRGSEVSMSSTTSVSQAVDHAKTARERKIAILNLPDTVNDARVQALMGQYGSIIKIQLRRDQNGAIVEFEDVKAAFNVRQGIDCSVLGADVKTGDVGVLLGKKNGPNFALGGMKPVLARPAQPPVGRRGGLGSKRGGFGARGTILQSDGPAKATSDGVKNNSAFRDMLEKSRSAAKE